MELIRSEYQKLKSFADISNQLHPKEPPPDPCAGDVFNWAASDPGFTDEIYQVKGEEERAQR